MKLSRKRTFFFFCHITYRTRTPKGKLPEALTSLHQLCLVITTYCCVLMIIITLQQQFADLKKYDHFHLCLCMLFGVPCVCNYTFQLVGRDWSIIKCYFRLCTVYVCSICAIPTGVYRLHDKERPSFVYLVQKSIYLHGARKAENSNSRETDS